MTIARTVIFLHTREHRTPTTLSYGCRAIFSAHLIKCLQILPKVQKNDSGATFSIFEKIPKIIFSFRNPEEGLKKIVCFFQFAPNKIASFVAERQNLEKSKNS